MPIMHSHTFELISLFNFCIQLIICESWTLQNSHYTAWGLYIYTATLCCACTAYRSFILLTRAHQMAPVFVISWTVVDREYLKLQHGCRRTLDPKFKEKQVRIARTGRGLTGEWGEGGGGGKEQRGRENITKCPQQHKYYINFVHCIVPQPINIMVHVCKQTPPFLHVR